MDENERGFFGFGFCKSETIMDEYMIIIKSVAIGSTMTILFQFGDHIRTRGRVYPSTRLKYCCLPKLTMVSRNYCHLTISWPVSTWISM